MFQTLTSTTCLFDMLYLIFIWIYEAVSNSHELHIPFRLVWWTGGFSHPIAVSNSHEQNMPFWQSELAFCPGMSSSVSNSHEQNMPFRLVGEDSYSALRDMFQTLTSSTYHLDLAANPCLHCRTSVSNSHELHIPFWREMSSRSCAKYCCFKLWRASHAI